MVNIGEKAPSDRLAVAQGRITMQAATLELLQQGNHKKGDVLGIARIAAIMATKRTADLIPLCHPLSLTHVDVEFEIDTKNNAVHCQVSTRTQGKTGVEMEALTGVQVALLTVYDMCKAVDRGMQMTDIGLKQKSGGKSGDWHAESNAPMPE